MLVLIAGELAFTYALLRRMTLGTLSRHARTVRIAGVVLLAFVGLVDVAGGSFGGVLRMLPWSLLLFFFPELLGGLAWPAQRRTLDQPVRYRLTDAGLEVHSVHTHVQVDWAGITRARSRPGLWVLTQTGRRQIVLPRAAFTAEHQQWIDHFLTQRFPR
jgi:hypothetical protein